MVTGANGGVGAATATVLARAGAHVVLAARDRQRGQAAARVVGGSTEVRELDLVDLSSIRAFAQPWSGPLDVLVNNAGVAGLLGRATKDGFDLLFTLELEHRLKLAGSTVRSLAAHPAVALPSLFAATRDLPGASYIGPNGRGELRGSPTLVGRSATASDPAVARRLWEVSEELTGVGFGLDVE